MFRKIIHILYTCSERSRIILILSELRHLDGKTRHFVFLACFLKVIHQIKYSLFTIDGVDNWGRVQTGKKCTCIGINSTYNKNVQN